MASVWVWAIVSFVITLVGGGIGWLIWMRTRPKKQSWRARIYTVGSAIQPPIRDKKGRIISDLKLKDLKPYGRDIAERIEKNTGIVIYRLRTLGKTLPTVTNDTVEVWGGNDLPEITVLLDGETCTLLRRGFDTNTKNIVFNPMPHDRINMLKSEMASRHDRLRKEKDILQAITPWIVTGILVMGLVGIAYFMGNSFVAMSENNKVAVENSAGIQKEISDQYLKAVGLKPDNRPDITEEKPPTITG